MPRNVKSKNDGRCQEQPSADKPGQCRKYHPRVHAPLDPPRPTRLRACQELGGAQNAYLHRFPEQVPDFCYCSATVPILSTDLENKVDLCPVSPGCLALRSLFCHPIFVLLMFGPLRLTPGFAFPSLERIGDHDGLGMGREGMRGLLAQARCEHPLLANSNSWLSCSCFLKHSAPGTGGERRVWLARQNPEVEFAGQPHPSTQR